MKLIVFTLILIICTFTLYARDQIQQIPTHNSYKLSDFHELRIGVGGVPLIALIEFGTFHHNDRLGYSKTYTGDKTYSPSINLIYSYQFKKWLSFGASFNYLGVYQNSYNLITHNIDEKLREHFIGITPTVRFDWFRTPTVKLYSSFGLGLGVDFHNARQNNYIYPTLDLTGFGVAVGRRFFGFGEIGLSTNGLFKAGLGYRFNYKK